ncbi:MAG TPA: DMT family transporter [Candidatus Aquabacterium excrementipullorum]|nr:DMT family transporter [Candidatus Aquabacterium excrementipullorum]
MSATWLMVLATVLFAGMGVCVKQASSEVTTAEVVFFRGFVGAIMIGALAWHRKLPLRTDVPRQHFWRSVAGVSALSLWFYTIGHLPLATAVTLNYMSSVWMGVFLIALQLWRRWRQVPYRPIHPALMTAVLVGFIGVALVLRPTIQRDQWLAGLVGLVSGGLSAWAYLQVAALGRSGEPEHRVVFYFSAFGTLVGLGLMGAVHLVNEQPWITPTLSTWGWLLGIGVFATLAQLAMTRAYALGQPLAMASLQYLGIVHAFVLGVWLFGEPVHLLAILGTVLIVLAGVVASRLSAGIRD